MKASSNGSHGARLFVAINGTLTGIVTQSKRDGRYQFTYDEEWIGNPNRVPLSLSMPMNKLTHPDSVVRPYLWGLLPDNERVLTEWGRKFSVSSQNPFALLAHVGEDCAGAVQFFPDDKPGALFHEPEGAIQWLTEGQLAERLRLIRLSLGSASRLAGDSGQFSLAGAQPKTALYLDSSTGQWGVPSGALPTSHIIKPALGTFDGFVENEHICLLLARSLGIPTAESFVLRAENELAIAVTRYDRMMAGGHLIRLHQEDTCQSLAVHPSIKYESQSGPGAKAIIDVIEKFSAQAEADREAFVDALGLSWLIANTDAHAKNYSFLIAPNNGVRLAPLYDLGSALPYPKTLELRRLKMAMRIGKEYRFYHIDRRCWDKFAQSVDLDPDLVYDRIASLAHKIPDLIADICRAVTADGLDNQIIHLLESEIIKNVKRCEQLLLL